MRTLAELRARYQEIGDEIRAILDGADNGVVTEEMQEQIKTLKEERKGVLANIETRRDLEADSRRVAAPESGMDPGDGTEPEERSVDGETRTEARVTRDREAEAPFESFGEQLLAIRAAFSPGGAVEPDKRLRYLQERNNEQRAATGMAQADPSSAGYLVAPEFSQRIWDGLNQDSDSLVAMTDTQRVTGESLTFNANAETDRATGSRWGGVQGYWIAEADETTSSKPKFRQVKVEPHELAVLVYATDKQLRNSPQSLGQYVERAATDEINFLTGDAIINGTGAGKPLGILNSGSIVEVAKESSQAADTILHQNLSKMWARLHPRSRSRAVWLHNVDVEPELDNLFVAVENVAGSENVGGLNPNVFDPQRRTIKGRPLMACEYCATLGDAGDIILWDPLSYLTGVREGVRTAMSMHVRFIYAESAFRFMYEIDGQPWLNAAQTPFKGSNTLTTHVSLAARA